MRCLILRLEGPLMAFGDVAVDEIRPTRLLPTLSMLTGLIGNALGLDHREADALQRLQERLRFAARADRRGNVIVDFQTAEVSRDDRMWTTRGVPAGRTGEDRTYNGPVLRYRHYLADATVRVALTVVPEGEQPTLDDIASALTRPERPLFLGRKGCPPSRSLLDRPPFDAEGLVAALAAVPGEPGEPGEPRPLIEVDDVPGEPDGYRVIEVSDRRNWRVDFHAGSRRVRELHST